MYAAPALHQQQRLECRGMLIVIEMRGSHRRVARGVGALALQLQEDRLAAVAHVVDVAAWFGFGGVGFFLGFGSSLRAVEGSILSGGLESVMCSRAGGTRLTRPARQGCSRVRVRDVLLGDERVECVSPDPHAGDARREHPRLDHQVDCAASTMRSGGGGGRATGRGGRVRVFWTV